MRKSLFIFSLSLCLTSITLAQIWHLPGEAMGDLTRLRKEALFEKWAPAPLESPDPPEPGNYVQYQHETLIYFFGPFPDAASTGEARAQLTSIRELLIARDPKFSTSSIHLHKREGESLSSTTEHQNDRSDIFPAEQAFADMSDTDPTKPGTFPGQRPNLIAFAMSVLLIVLSSFYLLKKTTTPRPE